MVGRPRRGIRFNLLETHVCYMERKVVAKLPLRTALFLLEQLVLTSRVVSAKIIVKHLEAGCSDCNRRKVRIIAKGLATCCPELFDEPSVVDAVVVFDSSDAVETVLKSFDAPRLGYAVSVR